MEVLAWAAMEQGNELEKFRYTIDDLGKNECLIDIDCCGICYSDLHLIDNDWNWSVYPLVPGHEIIGKVSDIGSSVKHLKEGQRVGVSWQRSCCYHCKECLSGNENLCSVNYQATAIGSYGGFATHIKSDARFTFQIPENIESKKSSGILCAGVTVYSGLRSAGMSSGQEVGIIGLGGLGHLAVQFASKLGNKVTVFEKYEERANLAHQLGADNIVITNDGVPSKLDEKINIMLNTVDKPIVWSEYLNLMDTDGTLCFVGGIGMKTEINIGQLISGRLRIMGSPTASRSIIQETLKIAAKFNIECMIEEFAFEDINLALDRLRKNQIKYKGVLCVKD